MHDYAPSSPDRSNAPATAIADDSNDRADRAVAAHTSRWSIQRTLANGGVIQRKDAAAAEGRVAAEPSFSSRDIGRIQTHLRRLGLYRLSVDRVMGGGTRTALVEAFGDDSWRSMSADDVVDRLSAVATPEKKGDHFHYGQMFRDGVLDISLGVGFDEGDNHLAAIDGFQQVLGARGFSLDAGRAAALYAQAGRTVAATDFGQFYVRENALTYTPPVGGQGRPIHAVVRLLFSRDGSQGGQAATAFRQGMAQSDVAYYSGHGRYGSGPDFDRNMSFELVDAEGNVEQTVLDYTVLERMLAAEGKAAGRSAWRQFLWRVDKDRLRVIGSNEGNVFLNPENRHGAEFGARLMYWNLERTGTGATQQTGKGGEMSQQRQAPEARDYRVLVFDGCRTQDYTKSIRRTPGVTGHNTDILATRRTVDWGDEVNTLAAYLDGIIQQQSKQEIVTNLDAQQSGTGATYSDQ